MIDYEGLIDVRLVSSGKISSEPEGQYIGKIIYTYNWSTDESNWLDEITKAKAFEYFGINPSKDFYESAILYNEITGVFSYLENMSEDEYLIESSYLKGKELKILLEKSGFLEDNFILEDGKVYYGDMASHIKHKDYALDTWISSSICEEERYIFRN